MSYQTQGWVRSVAEPEAVLSVALEVAGRLKDRDLLKRAALASVEQSGWPDQMRWRQHSIPQGSAGLALLFGYLDRCFPDAGWDQEARWHLEKAARSLENTDDGMGIPLFGGLSGVAFAAWYLSHQGRRYRTLLVTLDEALFPLVEVAADKLDALSEGVPVEGFDVISGITGAGVYLLCRGEVAEEARSVLERVLRSLVLLTQESQGWPRWRTPREMITVPQQVQQFPNGYMNCGLSHGIPGPLALLSLAKQRGFVVPGMDEAIERVAAWLSTHRSDDQRGVNWPTAIPLPAIGGATEPRGTPKPSMLAWCYGSPGVSRSLYLAGCALKKPEYCEIAIQAMQAAMTRPLQERELASPTFCHGTAGQLQVVLRFAHDTGLPVFQGASGSLLRELIAAYEPESILGYRTTEPNGKRIDNPGLLEGAPGVCLVLLAAAMPTEPTWDRLFLLS